MQLFKREQIHKIKKDQTRELVVQNERLIASLKKKLALQNDIEFDADKAKKVRDYEVWCKDLQDKMEKELRNLKAYQKLVDDKKEEYYGLITSYDALQDRIILQKEELNKLELQVAFKRELLNKSYA